MQVSLKDMSPGQSGQVVKTEGVGRVRVRLFDMGVTPGVAITLRKVAPLGDPIEITVRGYELSLRKEEAAAVMVELDSKR